ncbi:MAG: SGNH/GDSL hydrolase family protein [Bacilli bacterium]|nr:SGNH/GDSL hydrolase family protein [Bacilli bacterium]MDD4808949.1 SGNH/GDSL hydrolase family protein [Bacilli bacterium]
MNNKQVLCFGDSITQGRPGVTYLKYFKDKNRYYNYGLSGDTLIGMSYRIKKVLKSKKHKRIDKIIIGIGANDIIQSFLNNYSWLWKLRVKSLIKRGSIACKDEKDFKETYIKLIEYLKTYNIEIIVFSLPYIESNNGLNNQISIYNDIIKTICMEFDLPFIDFYNWQVEAKQKSSQKGTYFMSRNPLLVGCDIILTRLFPLTNYISKKRKLAVTIDGCHLNGLSAKWLANNLENHNRNN